LLPTPGQHSNCMNQPQSIDSRTPVMHPNHPIHCIRRGSPSCHRTPSSSSQRLSRFLSAKQAGTLFLYFLFSSSKSSCPQTATQNKGKLSLIFSKNSHSLPMSFFWPTAASNLLLLYSIPSENRGGRSSHSLRFSSSLSVSTGSLAALSLFLWFGCSRNMISLPVSGKLSSSQLSNSLSLFFLGWNLVRIEKNK
jgi:hypothetical protein